MKRLLPFLLILLALASSFNFINQTLWDVTNEFNQMLDYTKEKPYVNRVLTPLVINSVAIWIPDILVPEVPVLQALDPGWSNPSRAASVFLVITMMFFGAYLASYRLGKLVFQENEAVFVPIILFGILGWTSYTRLFTKIYDPAAWFLFTACVVFLCQKRPRRYLVCFALATLNKETSFLLIPISVLAFYKDRKLIPVLFWQGMIFVLIKLCLLIAFWNNPGGQAEVWFGFHMEQFGLYPLFLLFDLFVLAFVFRLLLVYQVPIEIRAVLALTYPLYLLYLIAGYPGEYRVFYEVLPCIVVVFLSYLKQGRQSYERRSHTSIAERTV